MKKTVLTSLVLVTVGILFGAILVSNFSGGVDLSFARSGSEVKLGGPTPVTVQSTGLKAISDNFVAVAKAVTPSVVAITVTTSGKKTEKSMPHDFFHFFGPDFKSQEPQPEQGMGSGVIITADGYIATNNHVVDDADKDGIEVVMHDKLRYKAKLIGTDPSTDLAVIKIQGTGYPAISIGSSKDLQVGQWVMAVGSPFGLEKTVTSGIISALQRSEQAQSQTSNDITTYTNLIQTDAAINPGNSGGALVDEQGKEIEALEIVKDKRPAYVLHAEFPAYGDFATAYVARFPHTQPVLGASVHFVRMRVSSERGGAEVIWAAK